MSTEALDTIVHIATLVALASIVAVALVSVPAYLYVRRIDLPVAEFRRVQRRSRRNVIAGLLLAFIIAWTIARSIWPGLPPLPSPWAAIAAAACIDILMLVVVNDARTFRAYDQDRKYRKERLDEPH